MRKPIAILSILVSLSLAGCGTTKGDRGLSGGLLGAGTGAAIGAMAGSAATGALWGGLGGAAIGLLTSSDTINLGKPIWNHSASSSSGHRKYASKSHSSRSARNDNCSTRETSTQRITTCAKTE